VVQYKQRKERVFESVKSAEDIIEMLKTRFGNRKLRIKYTVEDREVKINEFFDDNTFMVVTDPDYVPDGSIIIYGLLDKYIEIDLKVVETRGPGYFQCGITGMRRASQGRRDLRFKVGPEKVVATNFRISRHAIDISSYRMPTSIKVIMDQYQSQYASLSDIVRIDVFTPGDRVLDEIKKTRKNLYIEDLADPESLVPPNDNFLDIRELLGDELQQYIKRNIERGFKSIIVSPVIYISESGGSIPFAYFQVVSKSEPLSMESLLEVKELSFSLVDRIRDANTIIIPVHQDIVDISIGGARLRFTDENLKKNVMHAKGFIFDIVFRLQAPITIYGDVRFTFQDQHGDIFVGVDFTGNSSRKDEMKRFYSILKPMEVEYKNRLMKEMKQRKSGAT